MRRDLSRRLVGGVLSGISKETNISLSLLRVLFLIGFFAIGGITWLVVGRSRGLGGPKGGRGKIIPPDDDPDFLRNL